MVMPPPGLTESTAHVIASMLPRTSLEVTSRGSMPTLRAASAAECRLSLGDLRGDDAIEGVPATLQAIGQIDLVYAGTTIAASQPGDFTSPMPLVQTCHEGIPYSNAAHNIEYRMVLFKFTSMSR